MDGDYIAGNALRLRNSHSFVGRFRGIYSAAPGGAQISPDATLLCQKLELADGYRRADTFGPAARTYFGLFRAAVFDRFVGNVGPGDDFGLCHTAMVTRHKSLCA